MFLSLSEFCRIYKQFAYFAVNNSSDRKKGFLLKHLHNL